MTSQSETRNPLKQFHRRTSSKDQAIKISAPILAYSDASNRHDLYALPPRITRSVTLQSGRPTPSKLQKRIHIAHLTVGRDPLFPSATQAPAPSPTSIGVALGSPTYWPSAQTQVGRASLDSHVPLSTSDRPYPSGLRSAGVLDKEPRRRLFSSFFGRKASTNTRREFYKLPPSQISQTLAAAEKQQVASQIPERAPSTARVVPRIPWNQENPNQLEDAKPSLKKSATMPFEYPSRPPSPPPKDFPSRQPLPIKKPIENCPNCTVTSPMLKVTFPDTKLERYSVMFKDVLKSRQSLLARRHTKLKELQIGSTIVPEIPEVLPESGLGYGVVLPDQRLPHKTRDPEHLINPESDMSRRTGLSRSNTLPNLVHQSPSNLAYPKRSDSHAVRARSPSHGSETTTSMHSGWQSQESPATSATSDEDFDDSMCENIIIQLEDISLTHGHPAQQEHHLAAEFHDDFTLKQPTAQPGYLRTLSGQPEDRTAARKYSLLPLPAVPHRANLISISEPRATDQQKHTEPRQLRHFNPLKSSPASPTEITAARKLSSYTSQQILTLINAKQAMQPRITTVVDAMTGSGFELEGSSVIGVGAGHARNKSEHVVVESI